MAKDKNKTKKLNPKSFNPKKYIEVDPEIDKGSYVYESRSETIVFTFGRFSPPTVGHERLIKKMEKIANIRNDADVAIFASHSHDTKRNPIQYNEKMYFLKKAFGPIARVSNSKTIVQVMQELSKKYDKAIMVVGSDRIDEFKKLFDRYNGKDFTFKNIEVVSAGERDPDSDSVEGMSATALRDLAKEGNVEAFTKGLPKRLRPIAKDVYQSILKGMKLMEATEVEELEERSVLSAAQRRKRALVMKKYSRRIERAREKAAKRRASPEKLKKRARKKALDAIKKKLSSQKKYDDMSTAEKIALDKRLQRVKPEVINRMAKKVLPAVKKAENERMMLIKKGKNESLDDAFENFISESSQMKSMPKRFHNMYKKTGEVKHDRRFKMYKRINESDDNLADEIYDLMEETESLMAEGQLVDRAKTRIQNEKKADALRHKRMVARAKRQEKKESVQHFTLDEAFELKFLGEASVMDKALDAVHRHVLKGEDLSDVAWNLVRMTGADVSVQDVVKNYIKKYGDPDKKQNISKDKKASLRKKYGFRAEMNKADPSNREEGSDSLVKILKSDTPGEKD